MKRFFQSNTNLSLTQKICLSGLFIAITTILQKVLAINYIPIVPFLRVSFGGPAMIIFSSIFLGPFWGALIGGGSDILGYLAFDPKSYAFFPQVTLIYTVLGFVSFFAFKLFVKIRNKKIMSIIEFGSFIGLLITVCLILLFKDTITLYSSTYEINNLIRIVVPIAFLFFLSCVFVFVIKFNKRFEYKNKNFNAFSVSFACFILEVFVMIIFGTLMKGLAFGFGTYGAILLCQIMVSFINIFLNTLFVSLLLNVTSKYFISGDSKKEIDKN